MPSSVALGSHFEEFVKRQVASGRYNNVSEVVRDGLRLLQDAEDMRQGKLAWLRTELKKGLESGPATAFDAAEVKAEGQRLRAMRGASARK